MKMGQRDIYTSVEKIVGTPYLNEEFINGVVICDAGTFSNVAMRYNAYEDHIEFKENNQIFILSPDKRIDKIAIDKNVFVVQNYQFRGRTALGFLTLLDSGKVQLLAKVMINFKEAQAPKALESSATPAHYTALEYFYFLKSNTNDVREINNLKKMIEAFPNQHKELKEFADKEKISARKEDDLIKLVKHYNDL